MVWTLVSEVASVLMAPVRSAPRMAAALVFSAAMAITSGMRPRSSRVRPITRPCMPVSAGRPCMSMKS